MTEQAKQTIHPMAASMYSFVNEALTMEELEARLNLMKGVIAAIDSDIAKMKEPAPVAEESPEEARARKIAEFTEQLDAE